MAGAAQLRLCLPYELLVMLATTTRLWLSSHWLYVLQVTHDAWFF
jgi:hypothetical protein